ncbi:hypothetical protein WICPIJ_001076 [Wickerhamomyces pijperi]|uniref:Uncharacterized protein n=1 Tax=Wickerhamomyces pijperi TaxID=599730 RepID=A0A9P8TR23_WICPI|nr:hypothetical protein WICPIJ_001076 [Wickerhamomyces pijperi]
MVEEWIAISGGIVEYEMLGENPIQRSHTATIVILEEPFLDDLITGTQMSSTFRRVGANVLISETQSLQQLCTDEQMVLTAIDGALNVLNQHIDTAVVSVIGHFDVLVVIESMEGRPTRQKRLSHCAIGHEER